MGEAASRQSNRPWQICADRFLPGAAAAPPPTPVFFPSLSLFLSFRLFLGSSDRKLQPAPHAVLLFFLVWWVREGELAKGGGWRGANQCVLTKEEGGGKSG